MRALNLNRPLAVFDLETTGTDPAADRIVEISVLKVSPGDRRDALTQRVNPGRPIPPEATAVHGIRDQDVENQPRFGEVADRLLEFVGDADLAGFNIQRFDLPLLDRELREHGRDLCLPQRRILDAMTIFHRKEPRDLSAAVRFFLGREPVGAHGAAADTEAALQVLQAQLERYADLPTSVEELSDWCRPMVPGAADREGKFVFRSGEVVFSFGKHQGKSLRAIAKEQRGYLEWILKSDFPAEARSLVEQALRGIFPEAPPAR